MKKALVITALSLVTSIQVQAASLNNPTDVGISPVAKASALKAHYQPSALSDTLFNKNPLSYSSLFNSNHGGEHDYDSGDDHHGGDHDDDGGHMSQTSIPAAIWLFGSAIIGLFEMNRKKRTTCTGYQLIALKVFFIIRSYK